MSARKEGARNEGALRKDSPHESAVTVAVVGADTNSAKVSLTEPLQPTDCLFTREANISGTQRLRSHGLTAPRCFGQPWSSKGSSQHT